jgi:hypothetical protein
VLSTKSPMIDSGLYQKQDYCSPCEMSMQVHIPSSVQLHFEWSKTSEPRKGRLSRLFFYDGLEALKRFLSIFRVLIFDSKIDRTIPSLTAAPDGPKTRPPDSVRAASIACLSSAATLCRVKLPLSSEPLWACCNRIFPASSNYED